MEKSIEEVYKDLEKAALDASICLCGVGYTEAIRAEKCEVCKELEALKKESKR